MRLPSLAKCLRRSALAAVLLLAAIASPALAAYYPSGPQTSVDKSQLDGWAPCFTDLYADNTHSLSDILSQCDGDPLMLAAGLADSQTLTVLAAAPRADVIFDTGESNDPHNANGSGWYFNSSWSWGFAKQGDPISRDECDILLDPNSDLRLCWHTGSGLLTGGYRAGATINLNGSTDYARYVYEPVPVTRAFRFTVAGRKLIAHVQATGTVSVSDAAAKPSAAGAKKKKRKRLVKPSTASGGPPTIAVPLRLTKAAKSRLKQKGSIKVKARVTFTPEGLPGPQTLPNTQTGKLTISKAKKKK
jgi:hypothetical protein